MREVLSVDAQLIRGSGGIYLVQVGDQVVAKKTLDHGFPDEAQVVAAVRAALAAG